ncbi:MAG: glutamate-5-semialdehyde dehydrogenase [Syntrophorhabdaceae bacterium]|nr:glutamate-5-semialdehyde dehydrogenase [Syntrophorhabdaceae bacterium]
MKPEKLAQKAKGASDILAHASSDEKNGVLERLAQALEKNQDYLYEENMKDVKAAEKEGLPGSLIDRLRIDDKVVREMQGSLRDVVALPDPVGEIVKVWKRPNNLLVGRMRIPIGVILIIFESRPNVTIEAFSLCLKSGNCVILKGGSEAYHSNKALYRLIVDTLEGSKIPPDAVQFVETSDREYIYKLLEREEEIDLVIPRGGEALIRSIVERSRIPVLKHYKGVCHIYVDDEADQAMAVGVAVNAKVQKPATCNALETLLVHEKIAKSFLPKVHKELTRQGVTVKGCEKTAAVLAGIKKATTQDWSMEYLDLTLAVRVVRDMDEAVDHIRKYGSGHTDAIITTNYGRAWKFLREVNSSLVLVNASTRLNDGFQLGLGAEMGISTTRLHAFGPMGLEELTVTKFLAFGDGQLRT